MEVSDYRDMENFPRDHSRFPTQFTGRQGLRSIDAAIIRRTTDLSLGNQPPAEAAGQGNRGYEISDGNDEDGRVKL